MAVDLDMLNLIDLTGDQISSQFIIKFPQTSFFSGLPNMPAGFSAREVLSLRMDQSFDPPGREMGQYDIYFQGLKVSKSSPVDQSGKEFSLSFRLDENWILYQSLNAWYRYCFDDIRGVSAPDKTTRTIMYLDTYGVSENPVYRIEYHGVRIKSLKLGSFDPSSGEPVRVESGFTFFYQKDVPNPS